jgi:hypothetical protein
MSSSLAEAMASVHLLLELTPFTREDVVFSLDWVAAHPGLRFILLSGQQFRMLEHSKVRTLFLIFLFFYNSIIHFL